MSETPIYDEMTENLEGFAPAGGLDIVEAGDHFTWLDDVKVFVTAVAEDGTWCNLTCESRGRTWTKRQPLPLSRNFTKVDEDG